MPATKLLFRNSEIPGGGFFRAARSTGDRDCDGPLIVVALVTGNAMNKQSLLKSFLAGTVSALALSVAAHAQSAAGAGTEEVVVTGSRVATGATAPTPLTVVSVQDLQATTPSNIPDALNKLPVFDGSRNQRSTGGSTINWPGNFLNLRNFGANRTLILLDGMRVPATDASNQVDTNTLPQALMERVDVVTGGASAVYGSDAITGVVWMFRASVTR
jgi:outer membrane cobalamin receptor